MSMPSRFPASLAARPIRLAAGALLLAALVPGLSEARPGPVRAEAQTVQAGCLTASPGTLDFGPVVAGERKTLEIRVANSCRQEAIVSGATASPQAFGAAAEVPLIVPGLGSRSLAVSFSPADTGAQAGELRIRVRDSRRDLVIALRGSGAAAWLRGGPLEVSPSRLDMALPSMHAAGRVLTLRNTGPDSLRVSFESVVAPLGSGTDSQLTMLYLLPFEGEFYENNFVWLLQGLRRTSNPDIRSGWSRPPALEELRGYDLVVVGGGAWADPESTGNVLADYVDAGGKLLLLNPALASTGGGLRGRITGPGYAPVPETPASWAGGVQTSRFVDDPVAEGVWGFTTQSYLPVKAVQGAGRPVAYFYEGSIAAAYNAERPVAFVNVIPQDGDFMGYYSLHRLFSNIIDYFEGARNWLHVPSPLNENTISIAPGEARRLIVPVGHFWGLPAGVHRGDIHIWFNRPEILRIPATLTVTAQ